MTVKEFQTQIKGKEYNNYLYVDVFDDDGVWISLSAPNARVSTTLSKEQAKDMIAALIRVVNHLEAE